jgi:hypothetical protein
MDEFGHLSLEMRCFLSKTWIFLQVIKEQCCVGDPESQNCHIPLASVDNRVNLFLC